MTLALPLLLAALSGAPQVDADAAETFARYRELFPGGNFSGKPGEWATFRVGPQPYRYLRVAVLSEEQTPAGKGLWLEYDIGPIPEGPMMAMKVLQVPEGDGQRVVKGVYRVLVGKPQEIPTDKLGRVSQRRGGPTQSNQELPSEAQASKEKVTVAAGTFDCVRVQDRNIIYWLAPEAKVFHLVRLRTSEVSLELTAMGDGAKDQVGEPAPKRDGGS